MVCCDIYIRMPLSDWLFTSGTSLPLDPVDSFSRARLVCILLDTCGQYFEHGSSKKKLDHFLVFFQVLASYHKLCTSNVIVNL